MADKPNIIGGDMFQPSPGDLPIVGRAVGVTPSGDIAFAEAEQPIQWTHDFVPLGEMGQFCAMLDRAGVHHQRFQNGDGTFAVTVSPEKPRKDAELHATEGPLTGEPWASTDYTFDAAGNLTHIHMSGD